MAYTKNTWASGDVVTSAKLNNIENGIASGGVLVVGLEYEDYIITLDKTWKQIAEASLAVVHSVNGTVTKLFPITEFGQGAGGYYVSYEVGGATLQLVTDNENGYPSAED